MSIKIVTEPSVYLVAATRVRDDELHEYLREIGAESFRVDDPTEKDTHAVVEVGGRLCYTSFKNPRPGGNAAYIKHILECGHGSVLEHAVYTIIVTGVSRSLTHELVRHRHLSPSQLSQRFVDEGDCEFVVPPGLTAEVESARSWMKAIGHDDSAVAASHLEILHPPDREIGLRWLVAAETVLADYKAAADYLVGKILGPRSIGMTAARKRAREAARSVLPNCVATQIQLTGNARAWRGMLEQRGSRHADREIHRLALKILETLKGYSPNLFGDYEVVDTPDGPEITTPYRKV